MGRPLYTNNAASALAAGITSTQTTIQVQDGMGILFPTPTGGDYFYITVTSISLGGAYEIMQCTARSGDTMTVVRGAEGTSPQAFNIGDNVQLRITAAGMNFLTGNVVTSTQIQDFTATQGQTSFTLTNFDYAPNTNNLSVFVNGNKQVSGVNYTETTTDTFVFTSGLNVGDVVEAISGFIASGGTIYANSIAYNPNVNSLIPSDGTVQIALDDLSNNSNGSNYIGYNEGGTGAVNRTVTNKLQETVSVKDFGAIGDGVADDTAAIRAAIAASNCVYIPTGTYKIARTGSEGVILGLKSNFRIYGDGASSVIKFSTAVNATNFWRAIGISNTTAGVGYENITIENLALDGSTDKTQYISTYEQNHGVFFYSGGDPIDGIVINNIQSYSFSGDAIVLSTGTKNGRISNCSATDWLRQGINVNGIGNHTIIANYALRMPSSTTGGSGIHCEPSGSVDGLFITNNNVDTILVSGDGATYPLYNCKIIGNKVTGTIAGNFQNKLDVIGNTCLSINFGRVINAKIIGNQVTPDDAQNGIYVVRVSGFGDNVIISQNKVVGSGTNPNYGIYVNQIPYGTISGNTVTGFANGIGTQGGGYYTITNNYVDGNTYGIVLVSTVTLTSLGSTLVSANNISGATADMRISGNYFTDLRIGANSYANGTISTSGTPTFRRLSPYTQKGTTANRPTGLSATTDIGYFYLDTTLDADGKPIWWNGTTWIDATGAVV